MVKERDAEALGFVGEVVGDAGAGEDHEADGKRFEERVVALERRGLVVACPVGLEDDLADFAFLGPAGGDFLGAARRAAMEEDDVGVLGAHAVEGGPDARGVVAVDAAGEGDLRSGGRQRFDVGAAFGGDEIAAVDDRGGQR